MSDLPPTQPIPSMPFGDDDFSDPDRPDQGDRGGSELDPQQLQLGQLDGGWSDIDEGARQSETTENDDENENGDRNADRNGAAESPSAGSDEGTGDGTGDGADDGADDAVVPAEAPPEVPIVRIDVSDGMNRPAVSPEHLASIDDAPDAPAAFLAIDLGQTRLSAGIVTLDGDIVVRDRVTTPQRNVWPAVTRLVGRVIAANHTELRPRWCGVTAPGPIDQENGTLQPIGLPIWQDFAIRDELGALTGLPVAVDTPGRAVAYAELWRGHPSTLPPEHQSFATLVLGDEADGALVENGRVLSGLHGTLGQFGHIIVEPEGEQCACGSVGCLTVYAGARGIEAGTARDLPRTPPAIVERTAIMAGRACASLAAMLDVSEIVVAGVVPQVLGQPFYDALDAELDDRSRLKHLDQLRVRPVDRSIGPLIAAAAVARTLERSALAATNQSA